MPVSLFPRETELGLLTDFYELTMAAGYFAHGMADWLATFELWVRRLPPRRNFLVAAGLEQAVHYLQHLSFSPAQVEYLRQHPVFRHVPPAWFETLDTLRFTGEVWAVPEGTVVFAGEPILRVTAPLMQAQIIETYLMTTITFQTLVATKAARVALAAQGRTVVDFGSRRAHGPQAGLLAARAAFIAGCAGTSNTEAARLLSIPALGTQAHSWIMAFHEETEAFRAFGQVFPEVGTMLVDTYDTLKGVRHALESGVPLKAVRIDSGDLLALSQACRRILDEAGRPDVRIIASGDLNEYRIRDLLAAGAPIDIFGVGTEMVTSRDEPSLNTVYKLVALQTPQGWVGTLKTSPEKHTYPFAKQIYRRRDSAGYFEQDWVGRADEQLPGEPLLEIVLRDGQLVRPLPTLSEIQQRCRDQVAALPPGLHYLDSASQPYPVHFTEALRSTQAPGSRKT
ncbi:MAG: nicotinate phosphoribosyltransferase [Gemmatales bacterium]|nr:nicotinate phosphoribosyltransferase [Gemmatales bacterium]